MGLPFQYRRCFLVKTRLHREIYKMSVWVMFCVWSLCSNAVANQSFNFEFGRVGNHDSSGTGMVCDADRNYLENSITPVLNSKMDQVAKAVEAKREIEKPGRFEQAWNWFKSLFEDKKIEKINTRECGQSNGSDRFRADQVDLIRELDLDYAPECFVGPARVRFGVDDSEKYQSCVSKKPVSRKRRMPCMSSGFGALNALSFHEAMSCVGVKPDDFFALMSVESGFIPNIKSNSDVLGPAQMTAGAIALVNNNLPEISELNVQSDSVFGCANVKAIIQAGQKGKPVLSKAENCDRINIPPQPLAGMVYGALNYKIRSDDILKKLPGIDPNSKKGAAWMTEIKRTTYNAGFDGALDGYLQACKNYRVDKKMPLKVTYTKRNKETVVATCDVSDIPPKELKKYFDRAISVSKKAANPTDYVGSVKKIRAWAGANGIPTKSDTEPTIDVIKNYIKKTQKQLDQKNSEIKKNKGKSKADKEKLKTLKKQVAELNKKLRGSNELLNGPVAKRDKILRRIEEIQQYPVIIQDLEEQIKRDAKKKGIQCGT
jgi:hypothetical protein